MEEETFELDHDISTSDQTLFSYLHRLKVGKEPFFVSVATKEDKKEDFLEKFPDFLADLSNIIKELI
jgi:hypothetical protein